MTPTVAIIGGGCSGTLLAAQLLRRRAPACIHLIERRAAVGRGVAYSTDSPAHLLNVPAGRMSGLPDSPDDFLAWARRRDADIDGGKFLPRGWYGEYLEHVLGAAHEANRGVAELHLHRDAATSVRLSPGGETAVVELAGGGTVRADRVVLALGNLPPAPLSDSILRDKSRWVADPWAEGALSGCRPDDALLFVGTGLTMIDVALGLTRGGHRGPMIAVSRRGLLPQAHRSPAQPPPPHRSPMLSEQSRSARGLLGWLRDEVRRGAAAGLDWREVVNNLRPITPQLWSGLPAGERERFLGHLRPFWDVHRHRMAAPVAEFVDAERRSGRLRILGGRIVRIGGNAAEGGCGPPADGVEVIVRRRGSQAEERLQVARAINCTGPECDFSRSSDALVRGLLSAGLMRVDPLRIGLDTAGDGALLDRAGRSSRVLFTLGPPRRAQLWESTAVPEIRVQAAELAARLACE